MTKEEILKLREKDDINLDIPTKLPLRGYQKVGAVFMLAQPKCFMLDDPGLGKTPQAVGYLLLLRKLMRRPIKALIVVTSSTLFQWEAEVSKFSDFEVSVVNGSKTARMKTYTEFMDSDNSILLINYSKILHDFDALAKQKFDTIIFDEAQALKDSGTQTYNYYSWLTKRTHRIVHLTATPITNNLLEFYNLFELFHLKGVVPDYNSFRDKFLITKNVKVRKGRREFYVQSVIGSKNIAEFREMVKPYFIRRLNNNKGDFSKLKVSLRKIPIPMSKEQLSACIAMQKEFRQAQAKVRKVESGELVLTSDEDLEAFEALQNKNIPIKLHGDFTKVACCPKIYDSTYSTFSPKVEEIIKFLKNTDTQVVMFAKFIEFHKVLEERFKKEGIKYLSITGQQTSLQKEDSRKKFVEDSSYKVMLMTKAGQEGLNLQTAHTFVFCDLPYTPSAVLQFIGRVYRTGQTHDVDVYFFYMKNSLEEDLFLSLERKQTEIDEFFNQSKARMFDIKMNKDMVVSFLRKDYTKVKSYEELGFKVFDSLNLTI